MKNYFAAFVSQGYSYDSSPMAIYDIVGVVFKTPHVKHHVLFWFWIDVAAILALTDEGYGLKKTVVSSCDLC